MKVSKPIAIMLTLAFLGNPLDVSLIFGEERRLTIAVVDFTNTKKDPGLEYLVKGIPESIITYLGKKGEVRIVERSRLKAALEEMELGMSDIVDEQTAVEVGKAVGANAVMVGSFLQVADVMRINARLIDVKTSEIITAEQVQGRPGEEIFDLMDQTAEAMWRKLVGRHVEIQPIPITPAPIVKPGKPLHKRWWFWGILGAGIAGGAYVATSQKEKEESGTLVITINLP